MKKLLSTTLVAGIFASMCLTPVLALDPGALPQQWQGGAFNKNVDITQQGNNMNVEIQGGKGSVGEAYWDSFNVGSNAKVNFEFTAHNQTAFNQVQGSNMSQIYGQITNSSCPECGMDYAGTGKVILVNPNGVLFGDGANVNLNSFTVSNMNAVYDKDSKTLKLTKRADKGDLNNQRGIEVQGNAKIYGDKGVTFATDNEVLLYKGSLISTNVDNNGTSSGTDAAYGKVKIVTADGVNFNYYNNGAVNEIPSGNLVGSADKMTVSLEGEIKSGNIDVRNYSTAADSILSVNGATLKATKAVLGNDGNIWLTGSSKIAVNDSDITTENAKGAEGKNGGDVLIRSSRYDVSVGADINSVGNVTVESVKGNAIVGGSNVVAAKDLTVKGAGLASIQEDPGDAQHPHNPALKSTVKAKNVNIQGGSIATAQAKIDAENITLEGGKVHFLDSDLTATGAISAKSTSGDIYGSSKMNNSKVKLESANDINLKLEGVGNADKGLVAVAENNFNLETTGDLSISAIAAKKGNMHLKSNKLVMGKDYVDPTWQVENDRGQDRSFIYVLNGKFESVDLEGNDNFTVTASDKRNTDGHYEARHHIQGNPNTNDKFVLINKRGYQEDVPGDAPSMATLDDNQAQYLNKMPRQPEVFNNNTVVNNGRTTFVDVYAAASQIEIEDDEEE